MQPLWPYLGTTRRGQAAQGLPELQKSKLEQAQKTEERKIKMKSKPKTETKILPLLPLYDVNFELLSKPIKTFEQAEAFLGDDQVETCRFWCGDSNRRIIRDAEKLRVKIMEKRHCTSAGK